MSASANSYIVSNPKIKRFLALLKKEWLENQFIYYMVGFFIVVSLTIGMILIIHPTYFFQQLCTEAPSLFTHSNSFHMETDCSLSSISTILLIDIIRSYTLQLARGFAIFLTISYFALTLKRERQDGSIAFWRSMPINSSYHLLIKLIFGIIIIPIFYSIVFLFIVSIAKISQITGNMTLNTINDTNGYISLSSFINPIFSSISGLILAYIIFLPIILLLLAFSQKWNSPIFMMIIAVILCYIVSVFLFQNHSFGKFISELIFQFTHTIMSGQLHFNLYRSMPIEFTVYILVGIVAGWKVIYSDSLVHLSRS